MLKNQEILPHCKSESGNAIWVLLFVIGLIALLGVVVTRQSERAPAQADREQIRIAAAQFMRHAAALALAAERLRSEGISENDLCFDDADWSHDDYDHAGCADNGNRIYDRRGGGMPLRRIPPVLRGNPATGEYEITASLAVDGVASALPELLLEARVSEDACLEINRMLGIDNPSGAPPADLTAAHTRFAGGLAQAAGDAVIGDQAAELSRQKSGCRENSTDNAHYFYQVLVSR